MAVCASRDLDAIMVARPEHSGLDAARTQREQLRADLTAEINRRLQELTRRRAALGVRASRVDLVPAIPAEAKYDFDSVLLAVQRAQTRIADARTQAETAAQRANQDRDRMLADAEAKASERLSRANTVTAAIAAVSRNSHGDTDRLLARRMFQEQVGTILGRAGKVYVTDKSGEARLILPGGPSP
jgi:regulator of protease activity HflC (stomatin/prohibitin superfamily)